jgi:hypothetical protein
MEQFCQVKQAVHPQARNRRGTKFPGFPVRPSAGFFTAVKILYTPRQAFIGKASQANRQAGVKFLYTFAPRSMSHPPPDRLANQPDMRGNHDFMFRPVRLAPSMLQELMARAAGESSKGTPRGHRLPLNGGSWRGNCF